MIGRRPAFRALPRTGLAGGCAKRKDDATLHAIHLSRGSKAIEISSRYSREVADLRGTDMLVRRGGMPLLLAFVTLFARSAQAFFDPPWVTPESPFVGAAVTVNLRGGICDSIGEREGYPQITQQGNAIRLVEYGAHLSSGDPLCLFGNWTFARPIGSYPPGAYTVTVDLAYIHPVFGLTILNIGAVPFTVSAPPEPVSVPTSSPFGMTLLLSALLAAALLALRRDRVLRHVATPLLLAFVAVFAQSAQAFFDPPWITPEKPMAGQTVSARRAAQSRVVPQPHRSASADRALTAALQRTTAAQRAPLPTPCAGSPGVAGNR